MRAAPWPWEAMGAGAPRGRALSRCAVRAWWRGAQPIGASHRPWRRGGAGWKQSAASVRMSCVGAGCCPLPPPVLAAAVTADTLCVGAAGSLLLPLLHTTHTLPSLQMYHYCCCRRCRGSPSSSRCLSAAVAARPAGWGRVGSLTVSCRPPRRYSVGRVTCRRHVRTEEPEEHALARRPKETQGDPTLSQ